MAEPVSIFVCTYNGEKYLAETLDSLLAQDYPDFEVVASDDVSKDGTWEILQAYAAKNPRLRVYRNERNLGLTANVNRAVSLCRGTFIVGVGQDDVLPPDHLSKMVKWFDAPDVAFVHCNAIQIDGEGNRGKLLADDAKQIMRSKNPLKHLAMKNFIKSCGLMFRKAAFEDIGGWSEAYRWDGEYSSYVAYAEKYRIRYATDTRAFYRVHAANISKTIERDPLFEADIEKTRKRARAAAQLGLFEALWLDFSVWKSKARRQMKVGRG